MLVLDSGEFAMFSTVWRSTYAELGLTATCRKHRTAAAVTENLPIHYASKLRVFHLVWNGARRLRLRYHAFAEVVKPENVLAEIRILEQEDNVAMRETDFLLDPACVEAAALIGEACAVAEVAFIILSMEKGDGCVTGIKLPSHAASCLEVSGPGPYLKNDVCRTEAGSMHQDRGKRYPCRDLSTAATKTRSSKEGFDQPFTEKIRVPPAQP